MEIMPETSRKGMQDDDHIPPHEIEMIKYRDNRTMLIFKLMSGEELEGAIRWFDQAAIRLIQSDRSELTVMRSAISYYRTRV